MKADTRTLRRAAAEAVTDEEAWWRSIPSMSTELSVRQSTASAANEPEADEPIDYWEQVAVARLRLAQRALVAGLVASVVIALILG